MRNIRWSALAISLMLLQVLFVFSQTTIKSVDETRKAFKKLLDRPKLPLDVKQISKTTSGSYTYETVDFTSDKKADGSAERVPTYIVSPTQKKAKLPAVIMLHGTGGNKEGQKSWLEEFAKRGWIGVAIDARHHGARSGGKKVQRLITKQSLKLGVLRRINRSPCLFTLKPVGIFGAPLIIVCNAMMLILHA